MIDQETLRAALPLLPAAVGGFALGWLYFRAVRWTAALYGAAGDWRVPALLTAGRLLVAALAFWAAARFGPGPLLAAFVGFLAARRLATRRARREAA